jgi:hypothetical protein
MSIGTLLQRVQQSRLETYTSGRNGGSDPAIIAETDQTGNAYFNGDDGYALVFGGEDDYTFVDIIGNFEGDPGSGWPVAGVENATANHTLVRKSDIGQGVGYDWASAAGTTAEDSQWIVYDQNTWDYLGAHVFTGTCGAAVPGCTNENATNYNSDATTDDGSCTFDNACNVDGVVVTTGSLYYDPADLSIEPGVTGGLGKCRWNAQCEWPHKHDYRGNHLAIRKISSSHL